jgi:hypothetical protein
VAWLHKTPAELGRLEVVAVLVVAICICQTYTLAMLTRTQSVLALGAAVERQMYLQRSPLEQH